MIMSNWNEHLVEVAAIMVRRARESDCEIDVASFFVWYADACHRLAGSGAEDLLVDYRQVVPSKIHLSDMECRKLLKRIGTGTPLEQASEFYSTLLGQLSFEEAR